MKAFTTALYVCGLLMLVATVMGAIDYTNAQKKGTIKKLYKEETPVVVKPINKEIDYEDFSRGEINRPEPITTKRKNVSKRVDSIKIENDAVIQPKKEKIREEPTAKENEIVEKKVSKKKNISYKNFSRGPIEKFEPASSIDTVENKSWQY